MRGPAAYHVITGDGTWLGTVALPPGFRLLDAREGRVLGVLEDEMEVQSVAVFALHETPSGG